MEKWIVLVLRREIEEHIFRVGSKEVIDRKK
jgi:hypothetical protein